MPPKKRKAASMSQDDEEVKPKKMSKRELREQAIQRAKLSMANDKKRVDAIKAKKSSKSTKGAAKKEDSEDSDSAPLPALKKGPVKKGKDKKQTKSPAKRRKISKSNEVEEIEPISANVAKTTKATKGLSQQAQALATQTFSPQNFSPTDANSSAVSQYLRQQQQLMLQEQQRMMEQHQQQYLGQAHQQQQLFEQYMMMQRSAYGGNQPPYDQSYGGQNQYHQQSNDSTPQLQQYQMSRAAIAPVPAAKATPRSTASTKKKAVKAKAKKAKFVQPVPATASDDDDFIPPPVASLEVQISRQVMQNLTAAEKNQPTPHTEPPLGVFNNEAAANGAEEEVEIDDEPIMIDDEVEEDDIETTHGSSKQIRGTGLLGTLAVAIITYLILPDPSEMDIAPPSGATHCFIDNYPVDENGHIVSSCTEEDGVVCPDDGVCKYGKLVECPSKHYQISENSDKCVLTDTSIRSIVYIQELLEDRTLNKAGCFLGSSEIPLFDYKEIQLSNPMVLATNPLEFSILETEFATERREGSLFIGLQSDHKLKLPLWCGLAEMMTYSFGAVGRLCLVGLHLGLAMSYEIFVAYPFPSVIVLLVALLLKKIFDYRAYRSKLVQDVAEVRQMAYDYLEDASGEAHIVLHVRDHIVMNNFSKSKRKYLIKDVWPRVIPDFKCDNRVRKLTRVIEGQTRDAWQWVAAVSAKKKGGHIQ